MIYTVANIQELMLAGKPIALQRVPEAVYHAYPAMSNSGLKEFKKGAGYWKAAREEPSEDTPARLLGRMIHMVLGEPQRFKTDVAIIDGNRAGAAVKQAVAQQEALGKIVIKPDLAKICLDVHHKAIKHPLINQILKEGMSEVSIFWIDEATKAPCKARLDWITSSGVICDWKTFDPLYSEDLLEHQIRSNYYHFQNAWYNEAYFQAYGKRAKGFYNVFIRTNNPVDLRVTTIAKQSIEETIPFIRTHLENFAKCLEKDEWLLTPNEVTEIVVRPFWS